MQHIYKANFCYYDKDKLSNPIQQSCWSGVKGLMATNDKIYIHKFRDPDTKEHVGHLVDLINQITPCELVEIKDTEYIAYTMLKGSYDQNLVLLNFIRYLWQCQKDFNYKVFFKEIYNDTYKDPLEILLYANKLACPLTILQDHSNCYASDKLVIRKKEDLLKFKGNSTNIFLTGK